MRPISAGRGDARFTLYFPVHLAASPGPPRFDEMIAAIGHRLGVRTQADDKGAGLVVVKLTGFVDRSQARAAFDWLKVVFDLASIDSGVPFRTYDTVDDPKPWPFPLPGGWPAAVDAGWEIDAASGAIEIDGMVNLLHPTIVPEHLRILDQGALIGTLVPRTDVDALVSAVASASARETPALALACSSYIAALSHDNHRLRFLGFTTCLELLADRRDRADGFQAAIDEVCGFCRSRADQKIDDAFSDHAERIVGMLEDAKKQSISESLVDLLREHRDAITEGLPPDHPYSAWSAQKIVRSIYRLRSKVAHEGTWGEYVDDKIHRAYQFVQSAAKTLLRNALTGKGASHLPDGRPTTPT